MDTNSAAGTTASTGMETIPEPPKGDETSSSDGERPPLPPRPSVLDVLQRTPARSSLQSVSLQRPRLVSGPTTALYSTNIQSQEVFESNRGQARVNLKPTASTTSLRAAGLSTPRSRKSISHSTAGSDFSDTGSVRSSAPTLFGNDFESLLEEGRENDHSVVAWKRQADPSGIDPLDMLPFDKEEPTADFSREFDEIPDLDETCENEEKLLNMWKSKRKHFLILSQSGKPIWNRHGSNGLTSGYIGIIQTIISFYENSGDNLRTFTAGRARFVVFSQRPLYLVAISTLGESEAQLRAQLEALYMQILSTLTLPNLEHIFATRPSTDLRRPLQGTENLLSALADSFTRGSPSTLLSSLECLRIRKTQRQAINTVLMENRIPDLLYGLIVAGGRLVSVVRPRTHSLHPGDLQLIFNMLFEADGVQAGGGESWIPICLPGFNRNSYLYMYVSYLDASSDDAPSPTTKKHQGPEGEVRADPRSINPEQVPKEQRIAILMISTNREAFFKLRACRDSMVSTLSSGPLLEVIRQALRHGRAQVSDILSGSILRHFLYKSRGNLQFVMPSYDPHFSTLLSRRRLVSIYESLHASVHAKGSHLKVHHAVSRECVSLAWITDVFELYCVASMGTGRSVLAQAANKVVQWIRREEERLFIIGGAVF